MSDDKEMYYIAIGYYIGSSYHSMPYWDHYLLHGTEKEAKMMYAKKLLEREKSKCSFRDYVKEYYEDYYDDEIERRISDEKIMEFLDNKYFNNNCNEYNDGWKKYKNLDKEELGKYFVKEKPIKIEFDEKFNFDKKL